MEKKKDDELIIDDNIYPFFTIDDLYACWDYRLEYLIDILNGEYNLEDARNDLRCLIGSEYDKRKKISD